MSKIGKKPIVIPAGVQITMAAQKVTAKGPKGELVLSLHPKVTAMLTGQELKVSVKKPEQAQSRALWGTFRSLLQNMVQGVSAGFEKKLEIIGTGYKAAVAAGKLTLNLGYSRPIELLIPKGLEVKIEKNVLSVAGADKQLVGEFAAKVRSQRKPEPYKGKGVKYLQEIIRRKAGKVVKAVGSS